MELSSETPMAWRAGNATSVSQARLATLFHRLQPGRLGVAFHDHELGFPGTVSKALCFLIGIGLVEVAGGLARGKLDDDEAMGFPGPLERFDIASAHEHLSTVFRDLADVGWQAIILRKTLQSGRCTSHAGTDRRRFNKLVLVSVSFGLS